MADQVPAWYVQQFSTNIQLLLQQKGSRLRHTVMTGTHVGSQASPVDQLAPITANKVVSRYAPMPRVDGLNNRRWVFPVDYDLPQLLDTFDKLRLLTDPTSHYVVNATYALGRSQDVEILTSMFATAFTGVDGATSTAFDSTNSLVGVNVGGTLSGLNVAKLRTAKKILMQNEVDLDTDPIYCVVNALQHDYLLQETQIIDLDFNEKPVLMEGRIKRFLGIDFIHSELVNLNNGTDDQSNAGSNAIPIYAKSGMYLSLWDDIKTDVERRRDLQGIPWQAYCYGSHGGARLDEKRVIKVWCKPT